VTPGQLDRRPAHIARVVSGGQTGVDRAALDFAISHALPYGGWCPRDGWAEDHPTPPGLLGDYPGLVPTTSSDPAERTMKNVIESHATVVIVSGDVSSPGTDLTCRVAREHGRPLLVVDVRDSRATVRLEEFVEGLTPPVVLNLAGPRESESPGIYDAALDLLGSVRVW